MKKTFFTIGFMASMVMLWAAPQTNVTVTHPTTNTVIQQPRSNQIVKQPTTTVQVTHTPTTVQVVRPTTVPTLQPASTGGQAIPSGGSYASYKNAKTLAPNTTDVPKANKLGKGEKGLGKDANAANKGSQVATTPKAESASYEEVLKKNNIPKDMIEKIKQKNFEASKMSQRKS